MRPAEIDMFNAPALARRLFGRKSTSLPANCQSKRDFKFKVGDFVTLSKTPRQFRKSYKGNYTQDIFIISSRRRMAREGLNLYKVWDFNNKTEGRFTKQNYKSITNQPSGLLKKNWNIRAAKRKVISKYMWNFKTSLTNLTNGLLKNNYLKITILKERKEKLRVSVGKNQAKLEISENPNSLELQLLVVHIELLIDMWFISQIDFCFGGKWRFQIFKAWCEKTRLEKLAILKETHASSIKPEDIHMQSAYSITFPCFIL